jgi:16S rRNA (guanine1207-N2)-methyltransferase
LVEGADHLVDDVLSANALGVTAGIVPPSDARWERVVLMMPRSKDVLRFRLAQAATRLTEGGQLWVAGHQRDGAKSAATHLAECLGGPTTVLRTKRRCRVLSATRHAEPSPAPAVAALAVEFQVPFRDGAFPVRSLPGTFSHGRLDPGTERLLAVLAKRPPEHKFKRAADPGCGTGVVATALRRMRSKARIEMCDVSAVACASARLTLGRNGIDDITVALAGIESLARRSYDLVVANPPRHVGRAHAHDLCVDFVTSAAGLLVKGGQLLLVANHSKALSAALKQSFFKVEVSYHDNAYRVWTATA